MNSLLLFNLNRSGFTQSGSECKPLLDGLLVINKPEINYETGQEF